MFDMNQAYFMGQFEELLAIDSTTGDFRPIQNYVKEQIKEMDMKVMKHIKADFWRI